MGALLSTLSTFYLSALLLGFEVSPGDTAVVAHVPETVKLCGVRARCDIQVGLVDTIDRQAGQIPRVDVKTKVTGLPAERACAIITKRSRDGRCHRAASARTSGGSHCPTWGYAKGWGAGQRLGWSR